MCSFRESTETARLTGPKPKEIKVETFRIDYLIRTPKVEKLSLQPIRRHSWAWGSGSGVFGFGVLGPYSTSTGTQQLRNTKPYTLSRHPKALVSIERTCGGWGRGVLVST